VKVGFPLGGERLAPEFDGALKITATAPSREYAWPIRASGTRIDPRSAPSRSMLALDDQIGHGLHHRVLAQVAVAVHGIEVGLRRINGKVTIECGLSTRRPPRPHDRFFLRQHA
jgi:hypothetical protein